MPIYAACPSCGARYPLEAAIADTEARRALAAAVKGLPQEVLRRLVGYLDCHSPPGRAMAWGKCARVIEELIAMVEPGTVQRGHGVSRAAPGWLWAVAMDEVAAMREEGDLALPLKGHGLLEEICYRLAGKAEGKKEAQAQASARGETPVGWHPSHRPAISKTPPSHPLPGVDVPRTSPRDASGEPISLRELISRAKQKAQ